VCFLQFLVGRLAAVFVVAYNAAALPTNQVHQWAHMSSPPRPVRWLQRWGLLDEVVKDPQMRAAEAFIKMDYPGAGVLETVNSPVFVDGSVKRKPTAAAEVGAHTREVLQELG